MEKKIAQGIVKALRKDRKGVQLTDGAWYANKFAKEIENISTGDEVKVTYVENGNWKNYETVELIKKKEIPAFTPNSYIQEASDNKVKSICVGYATQICNAEIEVLVPKCKDLAEARKLCTERRSEIFEMASALFELIQAMPIKAIGAEEVKVTMTATKNKLTGETSSDVKVEKVKG
jgi:hypothetical protein